MRPDDTKRKEFLTVKERPTSLKILLFSLPIMAGSILQQLYNTVDSVIVGRYLGERGLAAVGVAGPIMSLVVFFIYGIGIGLTVLLAQRHGMGDRALFRRTASTALVGGLLFCLPLTLLCILLARPVLILTQTPPEILASAVTYLRIVFGGLVFTFLYNYHSAALMATGDSRTPFFALAASAVLNVCLDVAFVAGLGWGTAGAALATVAAQGCSSLGCILYVYRRKEILSFGPRELRMDRRCLAQIVQYSSASALQQTVLYGGRLLVQGAVNTLGVGVIAGYNAACRIESFVLAPLEGVASSTSSFCAKQLGGGRQGEIGGSFRSGLGISYAYGLLICILIWFFAGPVIGLFVTEEGGEVVRSGVAYLRYMAVFYMMVPFTQMLQALFRGVGMLGVTIVNTILQISLRVGGTYLLLSRLGVASVAWGTLLGWSAMALYGSWEMARYFRSLKGDGAKGRGMCRKGRTEGEKG